MAATKRASGQAFFLVLASLMLLLGDANSARSEEDDSYKQHVYGTWKSRSIHENSPFAHVTMTISPDHVCLFYGDALLKKMHYTVKPKSGYPRDFELSDDDGFSLKGIFTERADILYIAYVPDPAQQAQGVPASFQNPDHAQIEFNKVVTLPSDPPTKLPGKVPGREAKSFLQPYSPRRRLN